jgi:hypothetical protein
VVLAVMALVDMTGVNIAASWYVAAALATVGAGLIVGAWFGRARGLIALGVLLALALGATTAAQRIGGVSSGEMTWRATSVGELATRYSYPVGEATLDLRQVDFTGQDRAVGVVMNVGQLTVLLPATVDVSIAADVNFGQAEVLGQQWSGADQNVRTVTDNGPDGVGGGTLRLDLKMDAGSLEVSR